MRHLHTLFMILSLCGLTACSQEATSLSRKALTKASAAGDIQFKASREGLFVWESSPQLQAWVSQPGISASQREARIDAAQLLGKYSTSRDTLVYITWDVNLRGSAVTSLPDGLVISGNLDLSRSAVETLDTRLVVKGSLNIAYTSVRAIAPSVHVEHDLIANSTAITELSAPIHVGGTIDLSHTPLTHVADDLVIAGSLIVRGSPLSSLPHNLRVGGNLDVTHCPLTALAADLQVQGDLLAAGTRLAQQPPLDLFAAGDDLHPTMRTIDLRDTQLSYDMQAYLRLLQRTDMNLLLGSRYSALAPSPPEPASFLLDDYVAAYRSQLAPEPRYQAIHVAAWQLSAEQTAALHALLHQLYEAPGGHAGPMAERVVALFAQMQTDPGARQDAMAVLGPATCTSPQEAVQLLEQAELSALVAQMGMQAMSETEIRDLGIRMLHRETVHRFANQAAQRYTIADVRRAEYTFETQLRSALLLPTLARAPEGPLCSVITDQDVQAAAQAA